MMTIDELKEYDREMLKSAFVTVFYSIIRDRKKDTGKGIAALALAMKKDKSLVSRWFSGELPNWSLSTVSDIANALDAEIELQVKIRGTGVVYSHKGPTTGRSIPTSGRGVNQLTGGHGQSTVHGNYAVASI